MKKCRTCQLDRPVSSFQLAHRSCIECEDLREAGKKRCTGCGEVKDFLDFHPRSDRPGTCEPRCKACKAQRSKELNARPENKSRYRDLRYRRLYGVGASEVDAMLQSQQGLCAICRQEPSDSFRVDHDHASGKVRGLLCHNCNVLLGHCSDSVEILKRAISYLEGNTDEGIR
ncbi:endonuclease VII domain-containing protein [Streptomyces sp. NPDC005227]|uniref:endonuclease VII domain-containing protein n=1 Tax=Streptomyces sp. NPDC005227 TaxID=3364707 RepID=UPI0036C13200